MSLRIRPWSIALSGTAATLLLASCQRHPDMDTLRTSVVAEVAGSKLTGADLERWLMASPESPTMQTASILTSSWIDQALFAEALRKGLPIENAATIDSMLWTDVSMSTLANFFAVRGRSYPAVTDAQADSLYDVGEIRVFQQLVVKYQPEGDAMARAEAQSKVSGVRARVETKGEDFTTLVKQNTDDPEAKLDGGIMPAAPRDRLPEGQLGGHLWTLRPGDFSNVYSSGSDARIFRRPKKAEARGELKKWLAPIFASRADSLFTDSLIRTVKPVLTSGAAARLRALAVEPVVAQGSEPLVTWQGGQVDPALARSWVLATDAPTRVWLETASDAEADNFLMEVARRAMVLSLAKPTASDSAARAVLERRYREVVDGLRPIFLVNGAQPSTGLPTQLMDSLTIAMRDYAPLPRALAAYLRGQVPVQVDSVARRKVLDATAFLYAEKRATDSTTRAKGSSPQ